MSRVEWSVTRVGPSIVGRFGMSIAAAAVPSEKPMSARTSIRVLSHGTRQDSLLTAVRTLHDSVPGCKCDGRFVCQSARSPSSDSE